MQDTVKMFIGFDHVESVAYHVFDHSIQSLSSQPVSITPIRLSQLSKILTRERHPLQTNEFSFSRWLVPYLCDYEGWAIFADCDMLCRDDISKLWDMRDYLYAVQVVKHEHNPVEKEKYLGTKQLPYRRKNWSSVMLMNCAKCQALTPEYINNASGLDLHQFNWLEDKQIGELPSRWNHLVSYDAPDKDTAIAHFTIGGPYFDEYRDCEFADEWFRRYQHMIHCEQRVFDSVKVGLTA